MRRLCVLAFVSSFLWLGLPQTRAEEKKTTIHEDLKGFQNLPLTEKESVNLRGLANSAEDIYRLGETFQTSFKQNPKLEREALLLRQESELFVQSEIFRLKLQLLCRIVSETSGGKFENAMERRRLLIAFDAETKKWIIKEK